MGYTHHFHFRPGAEIDEWRWKDAVSLGKACAEASGVTIKGADGTGEPIMNDELVCFNGDRNGDHNCETFFIERKNEQLKSFCKTRREAYDIVVCCFLLAFKYIFKKDFEYVSDGTTRGDLRCKENKRYWAEHCPNYVPKVEAEWSAAYKLFNKVRKAWLAA